ncbi:MAG: DNA translocase FtsK 4TM domain-containing protein, partial [Bacteroidota bacterium]
MAKQNSRKRKSKKGSAGPISTLLNLFEDLGKPNENQAQARRILAWSLLFFCLIGIISCISYFYTGNADQSAAEEGVQAAAEINNWLGFIGAKLAEYIVRRGFGIFGFVLLLYGLFLALVLMEHEEDYYLYARRMVKYVLFITLFGSVFFSYIEILAGSSSYDLGGGFGYSVNMATFNYIGRFGMALLILFALVIFIVINFNAEIRASQLLATIKAARLPESARNIRLPKVQLKGEESGPRNRPKRKAKSQTTAEDTADTEPSPNGENLPVLHQPSPSTPPDTQVGEEISFDLTKSLPRQRNKKGSAEPVDVEFIIEPPKDEPLIPTRETRSLEQVGDDNIGKVKDSDQETFEKIVPEDSQEIDNIDELFSEEDFDPTLELSDYERPPLELLDDHGSGRGREVNRHELEENKNKILKTLEDYGIKITSIKATIGPTVTLYEIVPAPGVRISKIKNLEDDIALSLAALGIRIIAPIPGQGTIGIEVPNSTPEIVSLRGVLTTEKFMTFKGELPIALGRTISNEVYVADLNKMPHLLIAGATGQGKSVGLNTVITSLLYKKHPAEIKFVLIDPKKVEMNLYQALAKHFLAQLPEQGDEPIITDVRDAVSVLKSLCIEMDNRYDLLKKARVRNLKEYNAKFRGRKLSPRKG